MLRICALLSVVMLSFALDANADENSGIDFAILDESLADGWRLVGDKGAQSLGLIGGGPVFNGSKAAAIEAQPPTKIINWSLELSATQSVTSSGFIGLRFAFHPGDLAMPARPVFTLYIDGLSIDLARESHLYQLAFTNQQWQIIEIPFEAFDLINYYYGIEPLYQVDIVESIRIEGNLTGAFYIDDVRLLTGTPQISAIPQATSVEALSWGRIKAGFHQ